MREQTVPQILVRSPFTLQSCEDLWCSFESKAPEEVRKKEKAHLPKLVANVARFHGWSHPHMSWETFFWGCDGRAEWVHANEQWKRRVYLEQPLNGKPKYLFFLTANGLTLVSHLRIWFAFRWKISKLTQAHPIHLDRSKSYPPTPDLLSISTSQRECVLEKH